MNKVLVTAGFGAALLLLPGCPRPEKMTQPPPSVRVQAVALPEEQTSKSTRYSGVVLPQSQVALAFRIPGYVVELGKTMLPSGRLRDVAEGDAVSEGQLLARLRPSEYRDKSQQASSQVAAAKAAAEKAQQDFGRAQRLYQSKSITKPEFDAAQAQAESTAAQLRAAMAQEGEAQLAVGDTELRAPFAGDLVKKSIEKGSLVASGTQAFSVANNQTVKVVVGVPDVMLRAVPLGTLVDVTSDALPAVPYRAKVSRLASAADPKTRTFDVEVEIPNPEHKWKPGMIAAVDLQSKARRTSPQLPFSAFVQPQGQVDAYAVFVVGPERVAKLRRVEIGQVAGNHVEVTQGLSVGEAVVTLGAALLADGQKVEVIP